MSLLHHRIATATQNKTMDQWGITACIVTHRLGGEDVMQMTVDGLVDGAPTFAAFAVLRLIDPDGETQFIGRVMRWKPQAAGRSESHTYEVVGPWSYLKQLVYEQQHNFPEDEEDIGSAVSPEYSARVILHRSPSTGAAVHIKDQISDALEQAMSKGAPIEYSNTGIPAVQPPEDQALDLRVSDVVRRELQWCPHIGCRWVYSTGTPTLVFGDVASTSGGFGYPTLTIGDPAHPVSAWAGEPRYDLLTPEYEIAYLEEFRATAGGTTVKWRQIHRDVSTVANGAFGKEISTVVLRGGVWNGETWDPGEPAPADGLAAVLHKAYARLFYEMSWTFIGQEVNWSYAPGEQWSVEGASASFTDARSVCQEIVRDIGAGTTAITCGPPTFLGLADRLALLIPNRIRGISNAAGESQYGFEKPDGTDGTSGGDTIRILAAQENVDTGALSPIKLDVKGTIVPDA